MGNARGNQRRNGDEENSTVTRVAEAAAAGARIAVVEAQAAAAAAQHDEKAPHADGPPPPADPMVGGVLPLSVAEAAAAGGAYRAIRALEQLMAPAGRRLASPNDLWLVKVAAEAGAAAGVRGVARMVAVNAPPAGHVPDVVNPNQPEIDLDKSAAAAAIGAWHACFNSVRDLPHNSSVNRWSSLLAPLLAACIVVAAAQFVNLFRDPHWSSTVVLGVLGLIILTLMVGVAAVPFKSISSESVSRNMAFLAFCLIDGFYTGGLCYMTWDEQNQRYMGSVAAIGLVALCLLIPLWYHSRRV